MQMQRQHQVRPPGLLDGMALALAEEVLRAVQNALPIHQAVRSRHAAVAAHTHLYRAHGQISIPQPARMAAGSRGH